jgi:hypothetical protein
VCGRGSCPDRRGRVGVEGDDKRVIVIEAVCLTVYVCAFLAVCATAYVSVTCFASCCVGESVSVSVVCQCRRQERD